MFKLAAIFDDAIRKNIVGGGILFPAPLSLK